ncbi:BatD family protein [Halosquirtibacter laminarini]|uniref:BatD family protein n=1 Tax=Halosquirtibacter laminarini TaxID=3374600 RepID=A0AC61NBI7_9BACT|nr:BatD family protein [Prolixibacteraceae bacterium]
MVKKLFIILVCIAYTTVVIAQKPFAKASIDRSLVYTQQPIKLTIKVYSPRWFTQGLELQSLKIKDAFIVPFTQTIASKEVLNRHSYSVLSFFYLVYPYKTGKNVIPAVPVTAYIPMGNAYKETKVVLNTPTIHFTTKTQPSEDSKLVSTRVYISDRWSKPFSSLKTGDVLEREITTTAYGTIPNFIPSIEMKPVDFARIYNTSNTTQQNINKESGIVISKRVQKFSYLFTEDGKYTMPGAEIKYFNPYLGVYKERKSTQSPITIQPNDQLGIVASMADSLAQQQATMKVQEPKIPLKRRIIQAIVHYKWYILGVVVLLFAFKYIIRAIRKIVQYIQERRRKYLISEKRAFKLLLKENDSNYKRYLMQLYYWMYRLPKKEVSIILLAKKQKNSTIEEMHQQLFAAKYGGKKTTIKHHFQYALKKLRKSIFYKKKIEYGRLEDW